MAVSDAQFAVRGLRPADINLGIHGGAPIDALGRMLQELDPVIAGFAPDVLLVYGGTTSTLAGAIVGESRDIPVAHVEAGLRSFNKGKPEERNQTLADHLSGLLFVPTSMGIHNP